MKHDETRKNLMVNAVQMNTELLWRRNFFTETPVQAKTHRF